MAQVAVPAHVSVDDTAVCVGLKKDMDFQGFDVKVICVCVFVCLVLFIMFQIWEWLVVTEQSEADPASLERSCFCVLWVWLIFCDAALDPPYVIVCTHSVGRLGGTSRTTRVAVKSVVGCTTARSSRSTTTRACATSSPEKAPKTLLSGWCRAWHNKQWCHEQAPEVRWCVVCVFLVVPAMDGPMPSSLLCRQDVEVEFFFVQHQQGALPW